MDLARLFFHHAATLAAMALAALPCYAWLERRGRSAWEPIEGAPVSTAKTYRDATLRPLVLGRAPALVRLAAYTCFVIALWALYQCGVAVWILSGLVTEQEWSKSGSMLSLVLLAIGPALRLIAGTGLGSAGVALLGRREGAVSRARWAATLSLGVTLTLLLANVWVASLLRVGRTWFLAEALLLASLAFAQAALCARAATVLERAASKPLALTTTT